MYIQDQNGSSWKQVGASSATSLFAGGAVLALKGVALTSPVGVGVAILSSVNALTSGVITKLLGNDGGFNSQFFKLCTTVTALALSTLALPYVTVYFGAHTFCSLSLELAMTIGIVDLITKLSSMTAYKIGNWSMGSFHFPSSEEGIRQLSIDQLKQSKATFEQAAEKFTHHPLNIQVAYNQKLVEVGEKPLPFSFTELGENWTDGSLQYLSSVDHSSFAIDQQQAINTLLFDHHILPQERPYSKDVLPKIDPEAHLTSEQAHWVHLHYVLSKEPVPTDLAIQFHKYQLPPIGEETFTLETPKNIATLSSSDAKWHFNAFQASPKKWSALTPDQQNAFMEKFKEHKLSTSVLPTHTYHVVEKGTSFQIPWKKVAAVALIILAVTGLFTAPAVLYGMSGRTTQKPNATIPTTTEQLTPSTFPVFAPQQSQKSTALISLPQPIRLEQKYAFTNPVTTMHSKRQLPNPVALFQNNAFTLSKGQKVMPAAAAATCPLEANMGKAVNQTTIAAQIGT